MLKKILQSYNLTVIRSYSLTVLFIFSTLHISAQKQQHEYSIYLGGGYAAYIFQKPVIKPDSKGFVLDGGVGFTGFFGQNWGIHTGAGFGFFNVINEVKKLQFITPDLEDCEGYLYNLHTSLNNYSETHKTLFVSIPLMLQYQTKMQPISHYQKDKRAGFYAMAGAKALLMVQNKYTAEVTSIYNAAYYTGFDNWITSQPSMGLGSFKGNFADGKMKFNILAMFAFEAGFKWQLAKNLFLYTGAYFDLGLYDYTKKHRIPYNNFTTQQDLSELQLLEFSKRMNLIAGGVKVRFAFTGSKSRKNNCCR